MVFGTENSYTLKGLHRKAQGRAGLSSVKGRLEIYELDVLFLYFRAPPLKQEGKGNNHSRD